VIQVKKFIDFTLDAWRSLGTMVASTCWVPSMYSVRGMQLMRYAVVVYVLASFLEQLAIYFAGQLIGGHQTHTISYASWLMLFLVSSWVAGIVLERVGNAVRELGWNLNDQGLYQNLTTGWFRKTPGEMMAEDRTVGPYQIESSASRMHNLQFTVFFQMMNVGSTVVVTTGFMAYVDLRAGLAVVLLLVGNLVAIFYINHYIHVLARVIDKNMRAIKNRLLEFWQNAVYVVGTGKELEVMDWLITTQKPVYQEDFWLWGKWYPVVDGLRSTITNVCLAAILWFGYQRWQTAEFASVFGWLIVYREQFWKIADIQRQIAREAEQIHALRVELEKPVAFEQGAFDTGRSTHANRL
jgi:ABC-type multidrug transport system fused ATPase/permease subunit